MKIKIFLFLSLLFTGLLAPNLSYARTVNIRGYYKKSGIYVMPSHRTSPNKSHLDNWSTKGNHNPFTGKKGTKKW